jgi:hypothetical protein
VCSAFLQDAIVKIGDLAYLPGARRFAGVLDRFCWEEQQAPLRARAGLQIDNVLRVQARGVPQSNGRTELVVVGLRYGPAARGGVIELLFSNGGALRFDVECIDLHFHDLSAPWPVEGTPRAIRRLGEEDAATPAGGKGGDD